MSPGGLVRGLGRTRGSGLCSPPLASSELLVPARPRPWALLLPGDVLSVYAVLSLLLFALRDIVPRTVIRPAAGLSRGPPCASRPGACSPWPMRSSCAHRTSRLWSTRRWLPVGVVPARSSGPICPGHATGWGGTSSTAETCRRRSWWALPRAGMVCSPSPAGTRMDGAHRRLRPVDRPDRQRSHGGLPQWALGRALVRGRIDCRGAHCSRADRCGHLRTAAPATHPSGTTTGWCAGPGRPCGAGQLPHPVAVHGSVAASARPVRAGRVVAACGDVGTEAL